MVLFRSLELWILQVSSIITTEMEDTYWIDIYNAGKASGYGASLYIIGLMPVAGEGRKCGY
jgi:hypothetical protein